jgi:integrase
MRHADAFSASLKRHALPKLGRLLVDSVDENAIVGVLAPLWHEKPAAARKLRQRIRTVLDFAKVRGWRTTGAPNISPRVSLGKQPRSGNFAAIPYADVPAFVAELRAKTISAGRLALLFTILTAARSGEVRRARWTQFDFEAANWTRPPELMKAGEAHVVTLSADALAVLEKAKTLRSLSSDFIFPGTRGQPLSDMALLKIVKSEAGPFTVHGFRAAFRTWAAEQMPTIPEAVAEAALAHIVPDAVVRAYQRAKFMDLRRRLLDAWGAYCSSDSGNVVRLASA